MAPKQSISVEVLDPKTAKTGMNSIRLLVKDTAGKPITGAQVDVSLFMPQMGAMAPMSSKATLTEGGQGIYAGQIEFLMAWTWQTTVTVRKNGTVAGRRGNERHGPVGKTMINRIIDFSARNRVLIVVLTLCLTLYGVWSMRQIPLDAIPDLSDPQVIIYTEWPGRSPDLIEDQVTYPIISAMLAAPHVSVVRGSSDYGFSYVYVIFEEGTDIYWGRTRVLEYMSKIAGQLPEGVSPKLGPDATGVGWAFQYALVDKTGQNNLQQMRSFNDWYLRYWLSSVPGRGGGGNCRRLREAVPGQRRSYRLLAYKIPLTQVMDAVRNGNNEVGARSVEMTGKEYVVRGRGYIQSLDDIRNLSVAVGNNGTPIRVRDVARVELGPEMRRGVAELNGEGEVTGGTVIVRYGQNVRDVIESVKTKLTELKSSLPPGVEVVTTYDRSDLIDRSIETLRHTLIEELLIVSVVILIFLWHIPSAIIPILTIPIAVILAFIPMHAMGLTANIMSLGGIAIAIGAMVDASIVVVEQTHKKLEQWESDGRPGSATHVIIEAVKEVGGPSFFSLLGDRSLVHADLRAAIPGRSFIQTAGVHEELLHDDCGGTCNYARSGHPAPLHEDPRIPVPTQVDLVGRQRRAGRKVP